MSSETDHPRQRTVAELLAAHGDSSATGRRHRRRAPEGPDENGAPPAQPGAPAYGGEAAGGGPSYNGAPNSFGGDPFDAYGGDPYQQDARVGEPRRAEPRASDTRAPEPRSRDAYGADGVAAGEALGSDTFGNDSFAGDSFAGDSFAPDAFGSHGGAADWRSAPASPLAERPRGERTGPDRAVLREPVRDPMADRSVLREPVPREPAPPLPRTPEPDFEPPRPNAPRGQERDFRPDRPYTPQPTGTQALAGPPPFAPQGGQQPTTAQPFVGNVNGNGHGTNGTNGFTGPDATQALAGPDRGATDRPFTRPPAGRGPAEAYAPPAEHDRSTDEMPRIREPREPREPRDARPPGMLDPGLTGPIDVRRRPMGPEWQPHSDEPDDEPDEAPTTMVGVGSAGAEQWQRPRPGRRGAGDEEEGGPPTQASSPMDFDDHPAGLDADLDDEDDEEEPQRRRLGRGTSDSSPGQAWAAVVAQWIIGAVGGAALWVGFRFLWRELPVVALAAAVLVTIGLVVVVRALLRNNDLRTTLFAVGVGLLLTVSPAILVLLGR